MGQVPDVDLFGPGTGLPITLIIAVVVASILMPPSQSTTLVVVVSEQADVRSAGPR